METMRTLGRGGTAVSALGFGCWAIGGEWSDPAGQPLGWGKAEQNAGALAKGPLTAGQLAEIDRILARA